MKSLNFLAYIIIGTLYSKPFIQGQDSKSCLTSVEQTQTDTEGPAILCVSHYIPYFNEVNHHTQSFWERVLPDAIKPYIKSVTETDLARATVGIGSSIGSLALCSVSSGCEIALGAGKIGFGSAQCTLGSLQYRLGQAGSLHDLVWNGEYTETAKQHIETGGKQIKAGVGYLDSGAAHIKSGGSSVYAIPGQCHGKGFVQCAADSTYSAASGVCEIGFGSGQVCFGATQCTLGSLQYGVGHVEAIYKLACDAEYTEPAKQHIEAGEKQFDAGSDYVFDGLSHLKSGVSSWYSGITESTFMHHTKNLGTAIWESLPDSLLPSSVESVDEPLPPLPPPADEVSAEAVRNAFKETWKAIDEMKEAEFSGDPYNTAVARSHAEVFAARAQSLLNQLESQRLTQLQN